MPAAVGWGNSEAGVQACRPPKAPKFESITSYVDNVVDPSDGLRRPLN